jgi:hypothetical protein
MKRSFFAASILIAFRWAYATSLTSTHDMWVFGIEGSFPNMSISMISPDAKPFPTKAGPITRAGHIVTKSNFDSAGSDF